MKKVILIIFTTITALGKIEPQFSLSGITRDLENGTVLYLEDYLTKQIIDSVSINNNEFYFETELPETPVYTTLRTKDRLHFRPIWLENRPMIFDQTGTSFSNAQVKGSHSENLYQSLHKEIDNLPQEENFIKAMEFVEKNPNSIVSAMTLSLYCTSWGKEKTKQLFQLFSSENKKTDYGKLVQKYININREPKIGEQFIDFEMTDNHGNIKKLSELKRKIVLLEFWASWCRPCREENPELLKTYKKFNAKGFEIFAVSIDDNKTNWIEAIEKDRLSWKHVSDLSGKKNSAALTYGVKALPTNFLINQNGTIIDKNLHGEKLNEKLIELFD